MPLRLLLSAVVLLPLLHAAQDAGDDLLAPPDEAADAAPAPAGTRRALTLGAVLTAEGIDHLQRFNQDAQRNATAIVDAIIAFGQAREVLAGATSDPEVLAAVQANLLWCRKLLDRAALKDCIARKGEAFSAAARQMEAVAGLAVEPAQAGAYLARADRYARANPGEHLQIAIRFTEVAERFPGLPAGTEANRRASAAVQARMQAMQEERLAVLQTRFTRPRTPAAGTTAPPSAQEQKAALAQIRSSFAKAYARRDNLSKARLAARLVEETEKNRADPPVFHQMASEAIRLAGEAEAYVQLLDAIDLLAGTFTGFDAAAEKQAALKRMSGRPVAAAIARLLAEPGDATANLAAGRWFCCSARRWGEGLPMLAQGADADLARVAGLELVGPKDAGEEAQLADAWDDLALKQRGKDDRLAMLSHALYWYQHALAQLAGLARDRVAARVAEIEKLIPLDPADVDWAGLTPGQWDRLKGRLVTVNARVDRFDPQISLAAGDRLRVVPHPTDEWTLSFDAWRTESTKASCGWMGFAGKPGRRPGVSFNPGALLAWIENGDKQNAGIVSGPGRLFFAPHLVGWGAAERIIDRSGTIRVKLVPVDDE